MSQFVLGISAFYHDSAAALIQDGAIVAAAQEERFSRKRHDPSFPAAAIRYCLEEAGLSLRDGDVVFYDKPLLKFDRLLETYLVNAPKGLHSFRVAMPLWLKTKIRQKDLLVDSLRKLEPQFDPSRLQFSEHHLSHAASAFYPSPFDSAAILTMDGVGEWATTTLALGRGQEISLIEELRFPHSLGLLYSAFTYFTGFKVNSGEYKLMGLAPYGKPVYRDLILEHLLDLRDDGSFRLRQKYFDYATGLTMTNRRFAKLFGIEVRKPEERLLQVHMDLAASIQDVTEEVVLRIARHLAKITGEKNLCLAGGVALNCVANGKLLRSGVFDQIWIQPAAGDAGGALGAALAFYHLGKGAPRLRVGSDQMRGAYLGPSFTQQEVQDRLRRLGARFQILEGEDLVDAAAEALAAGAAVGWFQGRMEFGPRALGARSIIADPRNPAMQKTLNLKVKFRESFRPFAPSVLRERVADWFEGDVDSPYMLFVSPVAKMRRLQISTDDQARFGIDFLNVPKSTIPAVTHVDYSARVQTVHKQTNPLYHRLLQVFEQKTSCPVLVNTSFNVRGEPIVCTPEDAFRCFMGTEIDLLVIENCLLKKSDQDASLAKDYKNAFELD